MSRGGLRGSVTVMLMTERGYRFLKNVAPRYKHLFNVIVVGSDRNLVNDYEKDIIEYCIENNINFVKRSDFSGIETRFVVAVAWRWLIKHQEKNLIIFHDSILPRYRGFSPLVNMLINGESEIGVTALFGAKEYDAGNIITQSKSNISYPITVSEAIDVIDKNYSEVSHFVFNIIESGEELPSVAQDHSQASYSVWRDEKDYNICWHDHASRIVRTIHALGYPFKGAATNMSGKKIRILDAEEVPDMRIENRDAGKVLLVQDDKPVVICGTGLLKIIKCVADDSSFTPFIKFRTRLE